MIVRVDIKPVFGRKLDNKIVVKSQEIGHDIRDMSEKTIYTTEIKYIQQVTDEQHEHLRMISRTDRARNDEDIEEAETESDFYSSEESSEEEKGKQEVVDAVEAVEEEEEEEEEEEAEEEEQGDYVMKFEV